jgi:hypothetical protein
LYKFCCFFLVNVAGTEDSVIDTAIGANWLVSPLPVPAAVVLSSQDLARENGLEYILVVGTHFLTGRCPPEHNVQMPDKPTVHHPLEGAHEVLLEITCTS